MDRLDKHFRQLTRQAFARYGFGYADILAQWPAIVGEELGTLSAPERIRWPRRPAAAGDKPAGTMVVRVAEGRALEFQHQAPRIIERINGFYGYEAVAALKIVQGTLQSTAPRAGAEPVAALPREAQTRLETIDDDRLRAALERLGSSLNRASAPSQTPSR